MKRVMRSGNLDEGEQTRARAVTGFLEKMKVRLRPLTHAGVPQNANRSVERQLVTANVVILLSILVTIPDIWVFFSVPHPATFYAGICALGVVCLYIIGFLLLAFGKRGIGVF